MSSCCAPPGVPPGADESGFRAVLWFALVANAVMFAVELVASLIAGSTALQADALDFLGDAVNYGITLFVLGLALRTRALAALFKGACMGLFGLWVLGTGVYRLAAGGVPEAAIMGGVAVVALAVNVAVAAVLFRYRNGDANARSIWLCSRNDAIANVAVMLAAGGVAVTGAGWPDFAVAALIASLALSSAWQVITAARGELREGTLAADAARG